jgi:formylglycine-generating enzyme required for sulfatase activity
MKKILLIIHLIPFYLFAQGDKFTAEQEFSTQNYTKNDLYWAYNTLVSAGSNATIFANNEKEVALLEKVNQDQNINKNLVVKSIDKLTNADFDLNSLENNYVLVNVNAEIRERIKQKSYLTGLTFKVSNKSFDNLAVLKNNVEQKFLLDYLKINFENEEKTGMVSKSVYLVPFSMLYRLYKNQNNQEKSLQMRTFLTNITNETGNQAMLPALLGENLDAPIRSNLAVKNLEKGMVKVNENLYVSDIELSNEQYSAFLQDLVTNKEFDKINTCRSEKVIWRNLLNPKNQNLSDAIIFANGHPDAAAHPIQNISYEAAKTYCEWITEVYNNSNNPKKKYAKVIFRLPTASEWEKAANNSKNTSKYPWGNNITTPKGCFLQNFNLDSDLFSCPNCVGYPSKDGGFFPVRTDAYYPNPLGLYQMIGNVAEMTSEKGKAKGGSWEDEPDNCTIQSVKTYEKPSPAIGFRVFMEIIQ